MKKLIAMALAALCLTGCSAKMETSGDILPTTNFPTKNRPY